MDYEIFKNLNVILTLTIMLCVLKRLRTHLMCKQLQKEAIEAMNNNCYFRALVSLKIISKISSSDKLLEFAFNNTNKCRKALNAKLEVKGV